MLILALDLATTTGYAIGQAGERPRSAAVRLKKPDDLTAVAWGNIGFLLRDLFVLDRPALMAVEAPLPAGASKGQDAAHLAWGAVGVVSFMAALYGIRLEFVNAQKVSSHFIGRGRFSAADGGRKAKKEATLRQAKALGLIDQDCRSEDIADAVALHSYASTMWGGARPKELRMFGEVA